MLHAKAEATWAGTLREAAEGRKYLFTVDGHGSWDVFIKGGGGRALGMTILQLKQGCSVTRGSNITGPKDCRASL